jgi:hypothetical protein
MSYLGLEFDADINWTFSREAKEKHENYDKRQRVKKTKRFGEIIQICVAGIVSSRLVKKSSQNPYKSSQG